MKKSLTLLIVALFLMNFGYTQTKAYINNQTKEFYLTANIKEDHKIFGYAAPDVKSQKLILFSIFTSDVENNPYKLPLGAYYETSNLKENDRIEFVSISGGFVKLNYISAPNKAKIFYVARKFVEFE